MGIPPLARGSDRNIMLLLLVVVVVVVVFLLHGRSKLLNATGGRNVFLIVGGKGRHGLVHVCTLYKIKKKQDAVVITTTTLLLQYDLGKFSFPNIG